MSDDILDFAAQERLWAERTGQPMCSLLVRDEGQS